MRLPQARPAPKPPGAEIVFALVGPAGTNLDVVCGVITAALKKVDYHCETIRLSEFFDEIDGSTVPGWPEKLDDSTEDMHLTTRMDAGDCFREALGRGDALALFSAVRIRSVRRDLNEAGIARRAYLLRSLKHPAEVATLREIYGDNFFLISTYAPEETRVEYLAKKIARDKHVEDFTAFKSQAGALIARDKREEHTEYGQGVRDTFPEADFFVDARIPNGKTDDLEDAVDRFVEILFDHPYHTPQKDEHAMFHAQAAAVRSAALGRQVGVAITNDEGSIVAVGTNDVPKAKGGQYWEEDPNDNRDFLREEDDNTAMKQLVVEQILERLKGNPSDKNEDTSVETGAAGSEGSWLSKERQKATTEEFIELVKGTRVRSLIEFERVVHAEMSAILDAARRGVSVVDGTLYTTTFPCHECTRHIVAAGITRVVYIAPYPKSLALQFHNDAVVIDPDKPSADKVNFEPFVGVSPRRYLDLFTVLDRRDTETNERLPKQPKELPKALRDPIEMPSDEVVECRACGEENADTAKFCSSCGERIAGEETPRKGVKLSDVGPDSASEAPSETKSVLSDPAIRFQENLKVKFFLGELADKGIKVTDQGGG